ncbi:SGNH/GDSL hydrolase family protein [Polynucleobacter sp. AP-Titi-500A-B4]|uniref:SGNH/GDSL hydrolase family protein n=1 Tax=Polynucleobacter sp. AP-Titi-500A-B4 TaxID=2576923 RepID=UPI001BFEE4C1|nr:SGNH/GDSL hydrolase family protein [Polynucleobacter sp. AP-Titi-500A-B4]QWE12818.1 SGNH/GDSL hydrolase family protein [Polynucleobacter sp. AP-Titi-500A-B4]
MNWIRGRVVFWGYILNAIICILSLCLTLIFCEFIARKFVELKPAPDYIESIRNSVLIGNRLWGKNLDIVYDIRGLYQNATYSIFRTSNRHLIEPDLVGRDDFKVLFIGSSTVEALYVSEGYRWVELLNKLGSVRTFNAGQSGANSVDAYYGYKYLTENLGMHFDLVVLSTATNDFSWGNRFSEVHQNLSIRGYHEKLKNYYLKTYGDRSKLERCSERLAICKLVSQVRISYQDFLMSKRFHGLGNVTQNYLKVKKDKENAHQLVVASDTEFPDKIFYKFSEQATENLRVFNQAVKKNNSKLLVISESSSYGASQESFYLDLRVPVVVDGVAFWGGSAVKFYQSLNRIYLEAAQRAGANTFDLADSLNGNRVDGGRFFYDSIHYNVEGCKEVARILAPVIDSQRLRKWSH